MDAELADIARNINAVRVTAEYMEHLKQNYHMLSDQYQACLQIAQGKQKEGGFLDPAFFQYCDTKKRKLFLKMKVWESAHPSLDDH